MNALACGLGIIGIGYGTTMWYFEGKKMRIELALVLIFGVFILLYGAIIS